MPRTVSYITNERFVLTGTPAELTIDSFDEQVDDIDIFPLVKTANVVGPRYLALVENQVYRPDMVLNIKPVAHILSPAIDRQHFTMLYIIDKQRDKLLGKLIRTVIVGTVRYNHGQSVGVVEGPHEMVGRCF